MASKRSRSRATCRRASTLTGISKVQVEPGEWQVQLTGRALGAPTSFHATPETDNWPKEEIWGFNADRALRVVNVEGATPIDLSQTNAPFSDLPAYVVTAESDLKLVEQFRGDPSPSPNDFSLARSIWLSFDGSSYTVQRHAQRHARDAEPPRRELRTRSYDGGRRAAADHPSRRRKTRRRIAERNAHDRRGQRNTSPAPRYRRRLGNGCRSAVGRTESAAGLASAVDARCRSRADRVAAVVDVVGHLPRRHQRGACVAPARARCGGARRG